MASRGVQVYDPWRGVPEAHDGALGVAVGDGIIDVETLSAADVRAAVADAPDPVKAAARVVAVARRHRGVAEAIDLLLRARSVRP